MRILLTLSLMISFSAFAEVSRSEAEVSIDEMVKANMISAEEAAKAKARLHSMSSKDWSALNRDAESKASRLPASVVETSESGDLSQEQLMAIQNDLAVIAPHYANGK